MLVAKWNETFPENLIMGLLFVKGKYIKLPLLYLANNIGALGELKENIAKSKKIQLIINHNCMSKLGRTLVWFYNNSLHPRFSSGYQIKTMTSFNNSLRRSCRKNVLLLLQNMGIAASYIINKLFLWTAHCFGTLEIIELEGPQEII